GLFRQALVGHMSARGPQRALAAHRALADCIQVLAPAGAGPVELNDPIQRYAFEREAEHLWALGETNRALKALSARTVAAPRDNLRDASGALLFKPLSPPTTRPRSRPPTTP